VQVRKDSAVPLLINLVLCLVAAAVIASGTAAALFVTKDLAPRRAPVQQKARAPIVGQRIQAWLDRKAEEQAYAEKEKAAALAEKERQEKAALAEKERAEALRAQVPPPSETAARTGVRNSEDRQAAARLERARRAKQAAQQEAKRRLRLQQAEVERAYGYAPAPRSSSYPDEFLTRRDRAGL
jgi:hypothetical protein